MSLKRALEVLTETEDLQVEDSEDFTEDEAQRATVTTGPDDLVQWLMKGVRGSRVSKFTLGDHQLRRRGEHLYYRVKLVAKQEPDKVLIFRVDWVKS